eukprot:11180799-Karenia_brevis.AAC.1
MNSASAKAKAQNAKVLTRVFYAFDPPEKRTLPQRWLDTVALRKNGMCLSHTFSWTCKMVAGAPMICRHAM